MNTATQTAVTTAAPVSTDVRMLLREGTRTHHVGLERALNFTRADLRLDEYADLLQRFYGLYLPLEAALDGWATAWHGLGLEWAGRQKVPSLQRDLAALGRVVTPETVPQCQELPRLDTLERSLGCFYVVEGSTLGGQLLSRHFHQHFGLTPQTGSSFFSSYGADVGPMWKSFQAALQTGVTTPDGQQQAVEAANETFVTFRRWLTSAGP